MRVAMEETNGYRSSEKTVASDLGYLADLAAGITPSCSPDETVVWIPLRAKVNICDITFPRAIIDSGAGSNYISLEAWEQITPTVRDQCTTIQLTLPNPVSATGGTLEVLECRIVPATIGGHTADINLLICKNLSIQLLIGNHGQQMLGIDILHSQKRVTVPGPKNSRRDIPYLASAVHPVNKTEPTGYAVMEESITLPPATQRYLKLRVNNPKELPVGQPVIVSAIEDNNPALFTPLSMQYIHWERSKAYVYWDVTNTSQYPMYLQRADTGLSLAFLPVELDHQVTPVLTVENNASSAQSQPRLQTKPSEESKTLITSELEKRSIECNHLSSNQWKAYTSMLAEYADVFSQTENDLGCT